MIVPYEQLSADALQALLEEFVSREEDVHMQLNLQQKSEQVLRQLKNRQAVIVYDDLTESTSIITVDQLV